MENQVIDRIEECLSNFGLASFRPMQEEAISSILNGFDTLVILPPGSGKSLIFQAIAYLRRPKLTVSITPLIALMDDQVRNVNGLRAAQIHSGLEVDRRKEILKKIEEGEIDLLYISPEGLSARTLTDCIKTREVGLLAIDEVHCVSLWGHSFRPSYLFINEIRKQLGNPQLALFTATAPPHVIEDVRKILEIKDLKVIMGEPFRDNIDFQIIEADDDKQKTKKLRKIIKAAESGSIIIYTATTKQAFVLWSELAKVYGTSIYHGKMSNEERRDNSELFLSGRNRIMVCTSAFGMGIDKPDVYTIIHFSIPGSLEAYIQESGRAGRDGSPSRAILFNCAEDHKIQHYFIHNESPSQEIVQRAYHYLYGMSRKICEYQGFPISYAQLKYFLEKMNKEQPWMRSMSNAAAGILIDMGYIIRNGNDIVFPFGTEIVIDEEMLEIRKVGMFKRLQIMINCAQKSDPELIKRYFKTNIFNEIKLNKQFTDQGFEIILGFIRKYSTSTTKLTEVLTGAGSKEDREKYPDFFGIYSHVWAQYIKNLLDELVGRECLYMAEIAQSHIYFLSEIGEAYLIQKGIVPEVDDKDEPDIHHHSNRKAVISALRKWQEKAYLSDNEMALFPKRAHAAFFESCLRVKGEMMSGEELLLNYSYGQSSTVSAFKQLILFFLNIKEKKIEDRVSKRFSGWRYNRFISPW